MAQVVKLMRAYHEQSEFIQLLEQKDLQMRNCGKEFLESYNQM